MLFCARIGQTQGLDTFYLKLYAQHRIFLALPDYSGFAWICLNTPTLSWTEFSYFSCNDMY